MYGAQVGAERSCLCVLGRMACVGRELACRSTPGFAMHDAEEFNHLPSRLVIVESNLPTQVQWCG